MEKLKMWKVYIQMEDRGSEKLTSSLELSAQVSLKNFAMPKIIWICYLYSITISFYYFEVQLSNTKNNLYLKKACTLFLSNCVVVP